MRHRPNWCVFGAIIAWLSILLGSQASGAPITIDPDAFATGTVLTNAFPGVTLTTRDGLAPGTNLRDVFSYTDTRATTGVRAFAHDGGDTTWGNGFFEFLRADFADGASQVWLDFFANDNSDSNPQLLAFDAAGNQLDIDSVGFVPLGTPVTLTVSAPNIAYIAAYWDEISRASNGGLDNLQYTPAAVPEPTTLAIWSALGVMGLVAVRRRRRAA